MVSESRLDSIDRQTRASASESENSLFNAVMSPNAAAETNVWRASFGETGLIRPRITPHPSPWGGSSDSTPLPAPSFPIPDSRPIPAPGSDRRGNSGSDSDGPWNKIPGSPWSNGGSDRDSGSSTDAPARPLPGGQRERDAVNAFNQDRVTRTQYSFENAAEKFKELGQENEVALELQMRDWLQKQNSLNPLTFMRGTAVIADGLGQFRLDEGSRIDLTSHQDTKPRILKGYDYDFGGEATTWLRLAAGSLVEAQQYVRGHKGLVIDGQPMDDNYIQQLKNLQTGVESHLNRIYGAHDVEGIYNHLVKEVRFNSGDWQQGLVRLKYQLDGLKSGDNKYVAKSARDVALGFLAEATYMSSRDNGEEARIMYREANQYLSMSQRLDGSAPDNLALQNISNRLRPQIEKAIDNQWKDPFGNPFEIPKPTVMV